MSSTCLTQSSQSRCSKIMLLSLQIMVRARLASTSSNATKWPWEPELLTEARASSALRELISTSKSWPCGAIVQAWLWNLRQDSVLKVASLVVLLKT